MLLGVIAYNLGNLLHRLILPLAIQSWSLTSLQQRLFKTGGRLVQHARYFRPPAGRKSLDREPLSADCQAHRATRVESDVRTVHRADTGSWIIAGSGVSEEGSHQRQPFGTCRVSGVGVAKAASVMCCDRVERVVEHHVVHSAARDERSTRLSRESRLRCRLV